MRAKTTPDDGKNLLARPLVVYALGFAERALQRIGRDDPDRRGDADGVLDVQADPVGMLAQAASVPAFRPRFGVNGQLVHPSLARQFENEMAAAPVGGEQDLLDLGRKQIDAA